MRGALDGQRQLRWCLCVPGSTLGEGMKAHVVSLTIALVPSTLLFSVAASLIRFPLRRGRPTHTDTHKHTKKQTHMPTYTHRHGLDVTYKHTEIDVLGLYGWGCMSGLYWSLLQSSRQGRNRVDPPDHLSDTPPPPAPHCVPVHLCICNLPVCIKQNQLPGVTPV